MSRRADNLGKSLHALGRLEEAGQALQEALRRRQDDPGSYERHGRAAASWAGSTTPRWSTAHRPGPAPEHPGAELQSRLGAVEDRPASARAGRNTIGAGRRTIGPTAASSPNRNGWSPLPGGRLLIIAEQEAWATPAVLPPTPLAAARLARPTRRPTFEGQKPLISLLRDQWPGVAVVGQGDPLPASTPICRCSAWAGCWSRITRPSTARSHLAGRSGPRGGLGPTRGAAGRACASTWSGPARATTSRAAGRRRRQQAPLHSARASWRPATLRPAWPSYPCRRTNRAWRRATRRRAW